MIYTTINSGYDLQDLFKQYNKGDVFTSVGYDAFYEWLEELYGYEGSEDYNINPNDIQYEFTQYSLEELKNDYSDIYDEAVEESDEESEIDDLFIEKLEEYTVVITVGEYDSPDSYIVQAY